MPHTGKCGSLEIALERESEPYVRAATKVRNARSETLSLSGAERTRETHPVGRSYNQADLNSLQRYKYVSIV